MGVILAERVDLKCSHYKMKWWLCNTMEVLAHITMVIVFAICECIKSTQWYTLNLQIMPVSYRYISIKLGKWGQR